MEAVVGNCVVYTNNAGVSVIHPASDCGLTVDQIAQKDVPSGVPYKIIDASELPSREFRAFWELGNFEPDGIGADYGVGSDWQVLTFDNGKPSLLKNEKTLEIKQLEG